MYNRYSPQSDGSYRKDRTPSEATQPTPQAEAPPPAGPRPPAAMGVGSFLRGLIPPGFDTGDLIVVLLLLLMAEDQKQPQGQALLTLALYLFL